MSARGHVSLVGAGPGDPGLLTRTAVARLRKADLVLYDALVDVRVLAVAKRARRFFVGKRAGRHALSQRDIHALMIRAARRGSRVVRLKGGDPFVVGRGGEEALALEAAGIPFDVVPGVTSAFAVPAMAGIPVTHRGVASAVLTVSGHDKQVFDHAISALLPNGVTLVIMMGFGRRVMLASQLLRRGWRGSTPAAIVSNGTRPEQHVWRGTVLELARDRASVLDEDGPALMIIGDVAAMDLLRSLDEGSEIESAGQRTGEI